MTELEQIEKRVELLEIQIARLTDIVKLQIYPPVTIMPTQEINPRPTITC